MTVNDTEEGGLLRIEIQLHTKDKGFQAAAKPGSKNLDASTHPCRAIYSHGQPYKPGDLCDSGMKAVRSLKLKVS